MSRKLYGIGAFGGVVHEVQQALLKAACDPKGTDGVYGQDTASAMAAFQQAHGLEATGILDVDTWALLMNAPVPPASRRCLELTAAFEGHGYTLAVGNFDGAWLTWGIIGFTMAHGEVQSIIRNVDAGNPNLLNQAFGPNADSLRAVMKASAAKQKAWADSVTVNQHLLAEPWRSGFARFGEFHEVQEEQRRRASDDYFTPAVATAQRYGLTTELGLALCFDVHVQNGGIKPQARTLIRQQLAKIPHATEAQVRNAIAVAVANCARAAYRQDVLSRKKTIATGAGTVHGHYYLLENWALGDYPTAELAAGAQTAAAQG